MKVDENFFNFFKEVWHYRIASVDNNVITISSICIGIFFMAIGLLISKKISRKVVRRALEKTNIEVNYMHIFETVSFYLLVVMSSLFALKMANIPITVFTLLGGAFAIGIGFGSQNIINNFISGLIIMTERPIKIGDFVEVEGRFGIVEDIGMRKTTIISPGNKNLIIPNSIILEKVVENWTHLDDFIRDSLSVGVAYGSDSRKVEILLSKAIEGVPKIQKNKTPFVWLNEFGDNALIFEVSYWIKPTKITDTLTIKSELRHEIYEIFNDNKITIAFPQLDLHVQNLPQPQAH